MHEPMDDHIRSRVGPEGTDQAVERRDVIERRTLGTSHCLATIDEARLGGP
jgi:hypothetical protein